MAMAMCRALSGMPSITSTPALSLRLKSNPVGIQRQQCFDSRVRFTEPALITKLGFTSFQQCQRTFMSDGSGKKTSAGPGIIARAMEVGASDDYSDEGGVGVKNDAKRFPIELYFAVWWSLNAVFNIYNKKVLNAFPFPWLTSVLSLAMGSTIMLALWGLRFVEPPDVDAEFLKALAPVSILHTIGFVAATVSLSHITVSSHHIIKSLEPACSVIISRLFMGEDFSLAVYLSLLPVIGGCGLAAATELNFSMIGFLGAMISNVTFVLRNIASKKGMRKGKQVGGMNYYACLSMMSCVLLVPFALAVEGPKLWVAGWDAAIQSVGKQFPLWVVLQCVLYHLHNQVSYMSLDQISPLSFSIGNTMKRVTVIVTSILIFRTPVSPINALGAAIAIFGTFLYSQAK
ncbi:hypothetical protein M758_1G009700 [Ceratodon purpureus]|nr:hypothetical protein M758_1G009700 [Ceratodon purpureus]